VRFVEAGDGKFVSHHQSFAFGATELAGMKLFFARSAGPSGSAGNCVACHPAPHFTDFGFHNTGATQVAYDALHGKGAFLDLRIPPLAERNADPERWLPASESHPSGSGRFRAPAAADRPGETDLGAWNVLGNPDLPRPQQRLLAKFCNGKLPCSVSEQLPRAIAAFRTPGLRDLGHSAPYLHDGSLDSLQAVLDLYRHTPLGAREGVLRNPDPELAGVRIGEENVSALLAFLRALNEDYD
jgi:cytochrome c peroxidase